MMNSNDYAFESDDSEMDLGFEDEDDVSSDTAMDYGDSGTDVAMQSFNGGASNMQPRTPAPQRSPQVQAQRRVQGQAQGPMYGQGVQRQAQGQAQRRVQGQAQGQAQGPMYGQGVQRQARPVQQQARPAQQQAPDMNYKQGYNTGYSQSQSQYQQSYGQSVPTMDSSAVYNEEDYNRDKLGIILGTLFLPFCWVPYVQDKNACTKHYLNKGLQLIFLFVAILIITGITSAIFAASVKNSLYGDYDDMFGGLSSMVGTTLTGGIWQTIISLILNLYFSFVYVWNLIGVTLRSTKKLPIPGINKINILK